MRKGPGEEKFELFPIQGLGFRDTGYIGIMEKKMETTIMRLYRV